MEPEIILATKGRNRRQRINRTGAGRSCCADDEEGQQPCGAVGDDLFFQGNDVHLLLVIHPNPAHGIGAQTKESSGFVDPGVSL